MGAACSAGHRHLSAGAPGDPTGWESWVDGLQIDDGGAPPVVLHVITRYQRGGSERRVQDSIPQSYSGVTILYVAQRISAVIDLENIFLLENGAIVGQGTHEELLQSISLES